MSDPSENDLPHPASPLPRVENSAPTTPPLAPHPPLPPLPPLPEASWYPDPAGSAQLRWWDGENWTDHLHDPELSPAEPDDNFSAFSVVPDSATTSPTVATPVDSQGPGYAGIDATRPDVDLAVDSVASPASVAPSTFTDSVASARADDPDDPDDAGDTGDSAPPTTPQIRSRFLWLLIALPLVQVIAISFYDLNSVIARTMIETFSRAPITIQPDNLFPLLNLIIWGLTVLLALADWRGLNRARVERPFHWAWSFLGGAVYIVGRSVIVYRRTGRGLTPVWVWLGVVLIGFCVLAVKIASALAVVAQLVLINER